MCEIWFVEYLLIVMQVFSGDNNGGEFSPKINDGNLWSDELGVDFINCCRLGIGTRQLWNIDVTGCETENYEFQYESEPNVLIRGKLSMSLDLK